MPLESRHKEIKKNIKSNKKMGIIIILIIAAFFAVVSVTNNSKSAACDCVNTYNKWESAGAGFGQHSQSLKNELERCRINFDGINNARKKCNE
jgi:hypothetical protein